MTNISVFKTISTVSCQKWDKLTHSEETEADPTVVAFTVRTLLRQEGIDLKAKTTWKKCGKQLYQSGRPLVSTTRCVRFTSLWCSCSRRGDFASHICLSLMCYCRWENPSHSLIQPSNHLLSHFSCFPKLRTKRRGSLGTSFFSGTHRLSMRGQLGMWTMEPHGKYMWVKRSVARSAVFQRNRATFEVLPRVEFFVRWFG